MSTKLENKLLAMGFSVKKVELNSKKIKSLEDSFNLLNVRKNDIFDVFITQGCAKFCEKNSKYREEYVIDANLTNALKLVELVSYFHISNRTLKFSETIKVGAEIENIDFVFISVPFFFPGCINNIIDKKKVEQLKWVMPIHTTEADYIKTHGSDSFEKKLFASNYDFFEDRKSFEYLD